MVPASLRVITIPIKVVVILFPFVTIKATAAVNFVRKEVEYARELPPDNVHPQCITIPNKASRV